jgi:2-polyprenyl-6-methoxyphenol hydroxylase-like FAD-dependent oxidoreductase
VILAGDVAHIHGPVVSQGMNLGMGIAITLERKLGATIQREERSPTAEISLALLDTYELEGQAVVSDVLDRTRAQIAILQPTLKLCRCKTSSVI